MLSQTTFVLALVASASAHMILNDPKPFGRATLNSSPLAGAAEFPCKQRTGVYDIDLGMNQWNAGETKEISFNGTAAHGGGSCQFSITTDAEPTAKSQWKVIHSVIGNCLTTQTGNYPDISSVIEPNLTRNATSHPVTMPSNMPDGRYTFAWSWVNKIGNREFYMNCAPIQVGSDSGSASTASAASALSALPDMFVANLPNIKNDAANGCSTTEGQDFDYPEPGQSVAQGSVGVTLGSTLTGPGCATQKTMGAGAGSIGSPSAGTPSTPSQGTTPSKPSDSPAAIPSSVYEAPQKGPSKPDGVFAPGASAAPTGQPSTPVTPPIAEPVQSTTPQAPSGDNTTSPSNGECTPCTNDGGVVCIGSKQFGLCNRGCAVAQDLAAGMACSAGAVVASTKRHVHFPRAHLHRRFSTARLL